MFFFWFVFVFFWLQFVACNDPCYLQYTYSILLKKRRVTVLLFRLSDLTSPSNRSRCTDLIYFKQIFFRDYIFSLVLKHRKSVQFRNVIQSCTRACSTVDESVRRRLVSFLACNLHWPCSLIETSDRVKWDSLIAKGFICQVSSQSLKRREAEKLEITINPNARPGSRTFDRVDLFTSLFSQTWLVTLYY